MSKVFRIWVEKREEFAIEAHAVYNEIINVLDITSVKHVRLFNRYDADTTRDVFRDAIPTVFSDPPVDVVYEKFPELGEPYRLLAVEYLPGQYDQRADSCAQCIQIQTHEKRPNVRTARVYVFSGDISDLDYQKICSYLINPVEACEAQMEEYSTLERDYPAPPDIEVLNGFREMNAKGLSDMLKEYSLAMDFADLSFCQKYFINTERRDPTLTELRMIDTYWSDHCRHTTFLTRLNNITMQDGCVADAFDLYKSTREELYPGGGKDICLMDLATIAAKKLKKDGFLSDLDESEEINACSINVQAIVDGKPQDWLLMFKNETHNHPTEIEPFGGAATCLGGAIRDPLSGRSYVYQAMRLTGAGDPRTPLADTLPGKLPQKKLTVTAANGYSSYGNQIGLATGIVDEIYHPGYVAKRMEIGAVIGAAPKKNVVREVPSSGDYVILLGGRTGRDGCGGATGSSKAHTSASLSECGAEVQKGNPPEERKLQRLFRNPEAARLIKRCNDFGAGGVSVAIGELADGLSIDLDAVKKKYEGLNGTELAISESQERMACVVSPSDAEAFFKLAHSENLEASVAAVVTDEPRLKMTWRGKEIVNLSREFINSNGAKKTADAHIAPAEVDSLYDSDNMSSVIRRLKKTLSDINIASGQGLLRRFDNTIGASSVLMPYGGLYADTPAQTMAAKLPAISGECETASLMSWGFDPFVSAQSPFHGAICAVVESIAKIVASGGDASACRLTFQEYFPRVNDDPARWGAPLASLLGAFTAQLALKAPAIGGKDSMSGSFDDLDVPPTLVSFAVTAAPVRNIISPELKCAGSRIVLLAPEYNSEQCPDFDSLNRIFALANKLICNKTVLSAWALTKGGVAEGIAKMAFGNRLGVLLCESLSESALFDKLYGGILLEVPQKAHIPDAVEIGVVTAEPEIRFGDEAIALTALVSAWKSPLESVFPTAPPTYDNTPCAIPDCSARSGRRPVLPKAKPRVLIPVFPGANCEYDTARAFEAAGAIPDIFVIKNLSPSNIEESVNALNDAIRVSQILMLPGGFSGGDEPDGSGKFIATMFRNPIISEATDDLLNNRDGLALGICNGFQALVKLGLIPYGRITACEKDAPTLTYNTIGRHQSLMAHTRICSVKSPWLALCEVGDIHAIPVSHGEGRFVANENVIAALIANGQIAAQYVNLEGQPAMDPQFNPNGSVYAIEGLLSPDGRVFGKMGHSERRGANLYINSPGNHDQRIFEAGVMYFR